MTEQTTAVNVFASATKKESASTKRTEKPRFIIAEQDVPGISQKLVRLQGVRNEMDNLEAERKMLEGEVKSLGIDKWCSEYQKVRHRPESFVLAGEKGGAIMVLPMDKYCSLNDVAAAHLMSKYGEGLVEKTTTYSFNPDLLNKYMGEIAAAIAECAIPDEDKAALLFSETKFSVRKGAIDQLHNFGNVQEVFTEIAPVVQLKNAK